MNLTTPGALHERYRFIRQLIWLYCILLITEGALRKWVFPSLSNPLLLIRDPLVILIYMAAFRKKCFPINYFISTACILAFFSFFFGILSNESNLLITLYGLRVNYLHLPLIFIIPMAMTREDVYSLGKFLLLTSIPMTALEVLQFYAPQEHWLNKIPGSTFMGEALVGGKGRLRASGTFSFTQGLSAFFPLICAFFLSMVVEKNKISTLLKIAVGICLVVAIPCSISRTLALSCAVVFLCAIIGLYYKKDTSKLIFRIAIVICVAVSVSSTLPFFDEGVDSFEDRWVNATGTTQEEFGVNIVDRFFGGFSESSQFFNQIRFTGIGIGMGSNVASKLLTGNLGFLLAENEWPKIILELGPLLGAAFIMYRIILFLYLLKSAYQSLKNGNILPLLLFAACGLLVLNGQWGPPTTLGFAVLGSGLLLAACNPPEETFLQKKARRYYGQALMNFSSSKQKMPVWKAPSKTV